MKKLNLLQILLSAAEFFFVAVFLVSVWQSDRALDKAGFGDPEKFFFWDRYAALGSKYFFLLWLLAVILSLFFGRRKHFISAKAYWISLIPDVLLPPLVLFLGWLALILI